MKKYLLPFIIIFFLGCDQKKDIKLAVNSWIGYAPLFYANEKGWLKRDNIELVQTSSLGESLNLYKNALVDALASTQYEYLQIKQNVKPIILLDKSDGGDMILSNVNIDSLKSKEMTAYLEINSVNFLMLKYFLKTHNISMNNVNLISSNQQELSNMISNLKNPILIVTYAPYDVNFKKLGFKVVASTKTDKSLLVIDAIFVDKKLENEKFQNLKRDVDKAINEIQKNPKKVFRIIRKYYPTYQYKDFREAIKKIKWINNPNKELLNELKKIDFPIDYLVK